VASEVLLSNGSNITFGHLFGVSHQSRPCGPQTPVHHHQHTPARQKGCNADLQSNSGCAWPFCLLGSGGYPQNQVRRASENRTDIPVACAIASREWRQKRATGESGRAPRGLAPAVAATLGPCMRVEGVRIRSATYAFSRFSQGNGCSHSSEPLFIKDERGERRQTVQFVAQVAARTPISVGCFCAKETR
jgi:hypothetical protein